MKEFEAYVPLCYNDGSPIESHKISRIGDRPAEYFDGITFFPNQIKESGKWARFFK